MASRPSSGSLVGEDTHHPQSSSPAIVRQPSTRTLARVRLTAHGAPRAAMPRPRRQIRRPRLRGRGLRTAAAIRITLARRILRHSVAPKSVPRTPPAPTPPPVVREGGLRVVVAAISIALDDPGLA